MKEAIKCDHRYCWYFDVFQQESNRNNRLRKTYNERRTKEIAAKRTANQKAFGTAGLPSHTAAYHFGTRIIVRDCS